ncbi:MAG: head-tail adaptor protein [Clostridium sp.]|nr:head-tail adaptor protein [Clostridium sp.]
MSDEIILNKRISFVTEEEEFDDDGFPVKNDGEIEYYKCWSNVKRLSFKEFYSAKTDNSKIIDSFRVRRCKKIDTIDSKTYKIKYNNNTYNIIYINPLDDDYVDFKGELINE